MSGGARPTAASNPALGAGETGETGAPPRELDAAFARSVLEGLAETPKRLECKFFYDAAGSRLFEDITQLPEYYPTRTELAILEEALPEIARRVGSAAAVIEPGSGDGVKTRRLLAALDAPATFAPIEISVEHMGETVAAMQEIFPTLTIAPIEGDFTHAVSPPDLKGAPRLLFFPGSTIGNFEPAAATALLDGFRSQFGADLLLIGFDLKKDPARLIAAYDDAAGVTAAFNKNILVRINRELGGDVDLDAFAHEARWNAEEGRIEMHLVSRTAQTASVLGRRFAFAEGESVHTENSYKYAVEEFEALAAAAGWRAERLWRDPENLFCVALMAAAEA